MYLADLQKIGIEDRMQLIVKELVREYTYLKLYSDQKVWLWLSAWTANWKIYQI